MRHLLPFSVVLGLAGIAGAEPKADFTDLNRASGEFVATMDKLQKNITSVESAAGTAKAFDTFAGAIEAMTVALRGFARKYPETAKLDEPPPEFAAAFKVFGSLQTDYKPMLDKLGELTKRFGSVPDVVRARKRLTTASEEIGKVGE